MTNELFHEIVEIAEEYLGPAAPRFIARQMSFHLGKNPEDLEPEDIPRLVEWTKVTLAMLTENEKVVQEYADKVNRLADK